ncbi:MAG: hypothetical protein V1839_01940 [archaeon]
MEIGNLYDVVKNTKLHMRFEQKKPDFEIYDKGNFHLEHISTIDGVRIWGELKYWAPSKIASKIKELKVGTSLAVFYDPTPDDSKERKKLTRKYRTNYLVRGVAVLGPKGKILEKIVEDEKRYVWKD